MEAQDYPIRHFEQMTRLAAALRELPAQIQEHSYSYESYGSWTALVKYKGVRMRIVFDGRDGHYSIQRSSSRKPPDSWGEPIWQLERGPVSDFPESELVNAIAECRKTG